MKAIGERIAAGLTVLLMAAGCETLDDTLFPSAADSGASPGATVAAVPASDAPLVTLRFDSPDLDYKTALTAAVRSALTRRPQATFEVLAVAPAAGDPAAAMIATARYADEVAATLVAAGVPAARIERASIVSPTVATSEVRVFVR